MDTDMKIIGEKIRQHRKAKGFTQQELAERAGLSTMSIRRYESGERVAPEKILKNIAAGLELPECFFLDERLPEIVVHGSDGTEVLIPSRVVRRIASCLEMNPYSITPGLMRDEDSLRKALDRVRGMSDKEYNNKESGEVQFGDEMAETEEVLNKLLDMRTSRQTRFQATDESFELVKKIYDGLNEEGQKKIVEYAMMLKYVPGYQRHQES